MTMLRGLREFDPNTIKSSGPLVQRVLSAAFMIPVVLLAIHVGGRLFSALVAFLCILMVFEWTRMIERKPLTENFYILTAFSTLATTLAASGLYETAIISAAAGGIVSGAYAMWRKRRAIWILATPFYILIPSIALMWLRLDAPDARGLTFMLFGIVWAADTGAFLFGKFIGGPKISYALSPSKTWAGIGGGILGGGLIAPVLAFFFDVPTGMMAALFTGALLGAASVAGDLAESSFKRKFGVKDISGIIPGHGGVLDRLDGMIFATMAMTGTVFLYMVL